MVIGIIAILASIILVSLSNVRKRARDVKRKAEISQIGRFLSGSSCYLPDAGGGDYDLAPLVDEFKIKYPQYADRIPQTPRDPRLGTEAESYYRYIVTGDGLKCALYANLEFEEEKVTLAGINSPTAGGGTGVFQATTEGWNGSTKYFQASK